MSVNAYIPINSYELCTDLAVFGSPKTAQFKATFEGGFFQFYMGKSFCPVQCPHYKIA